MQPKKHWEVRYVHERNEYFSNVTDCTNLCIWSSSVNTMDDINVDIGKSFSKSEKLKEWEQKIV